MTLPYLMLIFAGAFVTGAFTVIIVEIQTGWIRQQYLKRRRR